MAYVLIVDADRPSRRILRTVLEDQGHEVRVLDGGAEALRSFQAREPALVITELYLDGVDGIELLRAIKDRWADRPVVVSSSRNHHAYLHVARMAMALGASGFIEKPAEASGVSRLLEDVLAA